jgi:hypothetical protein
MCATLQVCVVSRKHIVSERAGLCREKEII